MGLESINQPRRSSEVECNSKTSILIFWLERGGGWGSSPSTSPANHHKLNVIQKQVFNFFFTGEGWWKGFESIDLPSRSSEVKCNPKMSILFFWLERGGRWGLSSTTSPADHQKLNVIQKWAFYFFGKRGVVDGLESIDQPRRSSEVERNPKMSISFFWLERGGRWGSSLSTSPADHHKLNVIQKWAFYFLTRERWQTGFESIDQPGQSSEVERNPKMSILFFGWRGVVDGIRVHWPAQPIIRSRT